MIRLAFHTQERWFQKLKTPKDTNKPNAWFGVAYYFWYYEEDAIFWGNTAKRRTGYYEVYTADIDCSNVLDTVFNETHYLFWIKQVERAITHYAKKSNKKVTLKEINDFFKEKGTFSDVDGIMFQDISENPDNYFVKEFQYKKRIQIAVYNLSIISNFAFSYDRECA